jgi:hypothetical protein
MYASSASSLIAPTMAVSTLSEQCRVVTFVVDVRKAIDQIWDLHFSAHIPNFMK